MPQGTSYYVDDVNIPNSWFSIEAGMNNKLYVRYLQQSDLGFKDIMVELPSEKYNGDSFRAAMKSQFNIEAPNIFDVVYDPNRNRIIISTTMTVAFMIFTLIGGGIQAHFIK